MAVLLLVSTVLVGNVYYPIFAAVVSGPGGPGSSPAKSLNLPHYQKRVAILATVREILPDAASREKFIASVKSANQNFQNISLAKQIEIVDSALSREISSRSGGKITQDDAFKEIYAPQGANNLADGGLGIQLRYPTPVADINNFISAAYAGQDGYYLTMLGQLEKSITAIKDFSSTSNVVSGTPAENAVVHAEWFNKFFAGDYINAKSMAIYIGSIGLITSSDKPNLSDPSAAEYALKQNPQLQIAPAVVVGPAGSQASPAQSGTGIGLKESLGGFSLSDNAARMLLADQVQILSKQFYSLGGVTSATIEAGQKSALSILSKNDKDREGALAALIKGAIPNLPQDVVDKYVAGAMSVGDNVLGVLFLAPPELLIPVFNGQGAIQPDSLTTAGLLGLIKSGELVAPIAPSETGDPTRVVTRPSDSPLTRSTVIEDLTTRYFLDKITATEFRAEIIRLAGANNPEAMKLASNLIELDNMLNNIAQQKAALMAARVDGQEHPIFNLADLSARSSLSIDARTGNMVFNTQIMTSDRKNVGYISFDPVTKTYSAQMSATFAGKNVRFFSDSRTNDVYVTLSSDKMTTLANGMVVPAALANLGPLELMSASVSSTGSVGGTFRYQNRVFSFNPNSQAFEIPIAISANGQVKAFSVGDDFKDKNGNPVAGKGLISIDTKGNLTGSYELLNQTNDKGLNQAANLFFDRTGNIGVVYTASSTSKSSDGVASTRSIGSVAFDIKGNISGTVNLGKALNIQSDVLLGWDKNGLTGLGWSSGYSLLGSGASGLAQEVLTANAFAYQAQQSYLAGVGTQAAATEAASVASSTAAQAAQQQLLKTLTTVTPWIDLRSGAFTLNTPVLSLGQINGKGDIGFKWPGGSLKLCNLGITKCESRPDVPTVPIADEDGNVDFSAVQCQHSYKQLFQTVKIYNDAKVEGAEAQAARSALIFKSFNDILGRNPGQAEYIDWYFIMNNQRGTGGYTDWECNKIELLKLNIEKTLKASKEAQCLTSTSAASATATTSRKTKGSTKASDCPAPPSDLMPSDPLSQTTSTTTTTTETTTDTSNVVDEFLNGVTEAAAEDPLWNGSGWTGLDESGDISKAQISLSKGYNAFFVPSNMTSVDASVLGIDKYVLFEFNGDGTKKWYSSERSDLPKYLQPGTGYYVYSRSDNVKVPLKEVAGAKTGIQVHQGWNLLANDTDQVAKLSELVYSVVKTAGCKTTDCTENKSLRNLYTAGRAYSKIYVVSNDKETDAAKAFQILTVDANNADSVTIPAGKIFWFFLK